MVNNSGFCSHRSIDHFLQHLDKNDINLLVLGKLIITQLILLLENVNNVRYCRIDNWLQFLINKINPSKDSLTNQNISFITFNYDRVIEQFLYKFLANTYNLNQNQITDTLKHFKIIHVHGSAGQNINKSDNKYVPFAPANDKLISNPNLILHFFNDIMIYHEERLNEVKSKMIMS